MTDNARKGLEIHWALAPVCPPSVYLMYDITTCDKISLSIVTYWRQQRLRNENTRKEEGRGGERREEEGRGGKRREEEGGGGRREEEGRGGKRERKEEVGREEGR